MYPSFSLCEDAAQDAGVKSSAPFDLETTDTCLHPHSSTSLIARAAGIANCAFWVVHFAVLSP